MMNRSLGFIGGGRITRILLEGMEKAGHPLNGIVVSDSSQETLDALKQRFAAITTCPGDNTSPAECDLVFLAVHPPVVGSVLAEIGSCLKPDAVLVSLAPKFTLEKLSAALGGFDRIARMIPNAASVVNAGYNPISFSGALSESDREALLSLLGVLGQCPVVKDTDLEAYAILTAMGPTYFWFQWLELKKLAVGFGLSEDAAEAGIQSMITGAARTMFESGMAPEAVLDLIPVKPIGEDEAGIADIYATKLGGLHQKLVG